VFGNDSDLVKGEVMRIKLRDLGIVCHHSNAVNWVAAQYQDFKYWEAIGWDVADQECPAFMRKALGVKFV
jgi:hypothetical protein